MLLSANEGAVSLSQLGTRDLNFKAREKWCKIILLISVLYKGAVNLDGATQSLFTRSAAQLGLYLFKVNNQLGPSLTRSKTCQWAEAPLRRFPTTLLPCSALPTLLCIRSTASGGHLPWALQTAAVLPPIWRIFLVGRIPACHEYVSSSKPAITKIAQMLAAYPENGGRGGGRGGEQEEAQRGALRRFYVRDGGGPRNVRGGWLSPPCAPPY